MVGKSFGKIYGGRGRDASSGYRNKGCARSLPTAEPERSTFLVIMSATQPHCLVHLQDDSKLLAI